MMEKLTVSITDALYAFCKEKLAKGTDWYTWKVIWKHAPASITQSIGNTYEQNVKLKLDLQQEWIASPTRRHELEHYYITVWGGVRGNKQNTLERIFNNSDDENIERGHNGIASWSKALNIRDPNRYAIYDARVGAALNALQIVAPTMDPIYFPLLPGRNKVIENGKPLIKSWAEKNNWKKPPSDFYRQYLGLCAQTARQLQLDGFDAQLFTVEMVLFAHAEELTKAAFPTHVNDLCKPLKRYAKKS